MTIEQFNRLRFDAIYADQDYTQELEREYGRDACNARYDHSRNRATEGLAMLHRAKLDADSRWLDAQRQFGRDGESPLQ